MAINFSTTVNNNAIQKYAGIFCQIKTGTEVGQAHYSADTWSDGPEVDIAPSDNNNKILIIGNISISEGAGDVHAALYRDNSLISGALGSSVGNATRSTAGCSVGRDAWDCQTTPIFYLDNPGTTSSVNYKIKAICTNGTFALNHHQHGNQNIDNDNSHISYITAIEVEAS